MTNFQNRVKKEVWIGLAHVRPNKGNDALGEADGAFVLALALAADSEDYILIVQGLLEEHSFEVLEIEDVEMLQERSNRTEVDSEVLRLSKSLSPDKPAVFDTFQAY